MAYWCRLEIYSTIDDQVFTHSLKNSGGVEPILRTCSYFKGSSFKGLSNEGHGVIKTGGNLYLKEKNQTAASKLGATHWDSVKFFLMGTE